MKQFATILVALPGAFCPHRLGHSVGSLELSSIRPSVEGCRLDGLCFLVQPTVEPGNMTGEAHRKVLSVESEFVQKLIEAGVHFGHRVSRWNPKMAPYIYGRKNLIHIMDIRETLRGLLRAKKYLNQVASSGSLVLFVGTKRQASETIQEQALRCGMPFVSERWLGGA